MSKRESDTFSPSSASSGEKHPGYMLSKSMPEKKALLREHLIAFQKKISELQHELQQKEERHRRQQAAVYQDVFEVLDAFEQLEEMLAKKQDQMDKSTVYLTKNIRSIHKKTSRILRKNKIEPIHFPDGKAEMKYCKIMETKHVPDQEEGAILSVLKTGYIDQAQDEVLRKAEVITVRNKQQA